MNGILYTFIGKDLNLRIIKFRSYVLCQCFYFFSSYLGFHARIYIRRLRPIYNQTKDFYQYALLDKT